MCASERKTRKQEELTCSPEQDSPFLRLSQLASPSPIIFAFYSWNSPGDPLDPFTSLVRSREILLTPLNSCLVGVVASYRPTMFLIFIRTEHIDTYSVLVCRTLGRIDDKVRSPSSNKYNLYRNSFVLFWTIEVGLKENVWERRRASGRARSRSLWKTQYNKNTRLLVDRKQREKRSMRSNFSFERGKYRGGSWSGRSWQYFDEDNAIHVLGRPKLKGSILRRLSAPAEALIK